MFESDNSHIRMVTKRWLTIKIKFQELCNNGRHSSLEPIVFPLGIFSTIYHQQTDKIHWVAYFLDPSNVGDIMYKSIQDTVFDFMRDYIDLRHNDEVWYKVLDDFYAFSQKQNAFNPIVRDDIWTQAIISNLIMFWQRNRHRAPELATFALRVFNTPASSVPSERSFSAMNYVLHKNHTRMEMERSNQCVYIYMNQRTLRRGIDAGPARSWATIDDSDVILIEDEVLTFAEKRDAIEQVRRGGMVDI